MRFIVKPTNIAKAQGIAGNQIENNVGLTMPTCIIRFRTKKII